MVRNHLERAGADPILFRLKLLDTRKPLIGPLLKAEIRSRQFFLLCQSKDARRAKWVRWERREAHRNRQLIRYMIDLDPPPRPWRVPRIQIERLLRCAFINLGFAWADRALVYDMAMRLKTGLDSPDGDRARHHRETGDALLEEHASIDHGFRTVDDRP